MVRVHDIPVRIPDIRIHGIRIQKWRPIMTAPTRPSDPVPQAAGAAGPAAAGAAAVPAVEARELTRRFGATTALDGVSFSLAAGTICGVLGRNGAGKTVLMSLITGQDRPDAGTVLTLGGDPFENAPVTSRLSFIRDNQKYPDDFKLRHVLRSAPLFHANWSAELAGELTETFRLPARTPVKKYSRGQLSALGVLIGLASRAPLTLLDEPYLGLDPTARQAFYDVLLRDYGAHPRTILVSTHLIDEMGPLLEHVLVIDRGRLVVDADTEDLAGAASTISGPAAQVDALVTAHGSHVVHRREVGSLAVVTVSGDATAADRPGVVVEPASLQDIVSAIGDGAELDERPLPAGAAAGALESGEHDPAEDAPRGSRS